MLNKFARPRPNETFIKALAPINNIFCLKGIPFLCDVPFLNSIPGIRGICNVRNIDFPQADQNKLRAICGNRKIVFLAPNHPEFFTDWMLDKHVTSLTCKMAANWATHDVVNGLGGVMQKFWLANNLIAQIPGNPGPSRAYSVEWASKGHGVLLHPEGGVGWHGNYIAPLFPGALEMAREALAENPGFESYVAPVIWKLVFNNDVSKNLHAECAYVERKLKIENGKTKREITARVYHIYLTLLERDEKKWDISIPANPSFRERQLLLIKTLREKLCQAIHDSYIPQENELLLRGARRWLRENKTDSLRDHVRDLVKTIARHESLGEYAFKKDDITQEELAEHLKRIRRDYCKGTLKDTLNAFVPQAAGARTAYIRVPEPFALHTKEGEKLELEHIRKTMQDTLDGINAEIETHGGFIKFENPFRG